MLQIASALYKGNKAIAVLGLEVFGFSTPVFADWRACQSCSNTCSAMLSSSSPLVTRVGLRVLEQGGNAADAAVAMAPPRTM